MNPAEKSQLTKLPVTFSKYTFKIFSVRFNRSDPEIISGDLKIVTDDGDTIIV